MRVALWFDVGFKRYTTKVCDIAVTHELWFDVGFKRYTTFHVYDRKNLRLWFDVGFKRYTTRSISCKTWQGCGLM